KAIKWELGTTPLAEIDSSRIEEFSQTLQARNLSRGQRLEGTGRKANAHTVNAILRALRRMLHKAVEWGLIAKVPKITMIKNVRDREYIITPEREMKLLAHAHGQMRPL